MFAQRILLFAVALAPIGLAQRLPNPVWTPNPAGVMETFSASGPIDTNGAFFQSLGTNGRSCATCHVATDAWTVAAQNVRTRFDLTGGQDPIFRINDGSTCDHDIKVSTVAERRQAYSLLLRKGLFRIAIDMPAGADFEVVSVRNPYGCNETSTLSVYRRPLPSTNLRFLSTVMWDGRESTGPSTSPITLATNPGDLLVDLAHQSLDATNGHAQAATAISTAQQEEIVAFEMGLYTAQSTDFGAGWLSAEGGRGGAMPLTAQDFFIGVNDPLGLNPTGADFDSKVFTLFSSWKEHGRHSRRASIARGEALFNTRQIDITGVKGLNDVLGKDTIPGTCGTCHDSPNVGHHSVSAPLNIGIADIDSVLGADYLPVIALRNKSTGELVQTTDPGRALITGKFGDIGKLKGPILRGLAARAPYFHNGSADTLMDVVRFYDQRFNLKFTDQEKSDLVAFLRAL